MWIFTSGGLLMPAVIPSPEKVAPGFLDAEGKFNIQVRGRVVSHLENFIRDYLDPMGLAHSEIQVTPELDYNCRIYMAQSDFAAAIAQEIMDIDFLKFKPTAETRDTDGKLIYKDGVAYHGVLNSIWSTLTRLGKPGGKWATGWGYAPRTYSTPKALTVGDRSDLDIPPYEDSWADFDLDDNFDYIPDDVALAEIVMEEMERDRIPRDEWEDYLSANEYAAVLKYEKTNKRHGRRAKKSTRRRLFSKR